MPASSGIHHITAIAGEPRRNVDFYTRALGLRLVKKTVNFDDPGAYHLYYGDKIGSPGSILTFFPWTGVPGGRPGSGQAVEIGFGAPKTSEDYWARRLLQLGISHDVGERFGERLLFFRDPDGMQLSVVFTIEAGVMTGWSEGEIPADHALRGVWNVALWTRDSAASAGLLTRAFGWRRTGTDDASGRIRYSAAGAGLGRHVELRSGPGGAGAIGAGVIHHVAFRADGDAAQAELAANLRKLGIFSSEQKDRRYFRSIYFREPSGILFEIATDPPGFTVDEPLAKLGQTLQLPPWLEPRRAAIAERLPPLD